MADRDIVNAAAVSADRPWEPFTCEQRTTGTPSSPTASSAPRMSVGENLTFGNLATVDNSEYGRDRPAQARATPSAALSPRIGPSALATDDAIDTRYRLRRQLRNTTCHLRCKRRFHEINTTALPPRETEVQSDSSGPGIAASAFALSTSSSRLRIKTRATTTTMATAAKPKSTGRLSLVMRSPARYAPSP